MNQTKGNKRSRFFALLVASVLSAASLSAQAQNRTIKGCITDANNKEPLMGATITLDGCRDRPRRQLHSHRSGRNKANNCILYWLYSQNRATQRRRNQHHTRLQRPSAGRSCGGGLWYRTQERLDRFGGNG